MFEIIKFIIENIIRFSNVLDIYLLDQASTRKSLSALALAISTPRWTFFAYLLVCLSPLDYFPSIGSIIHAPWIVCMVPPSIFPARCAGSYWFRCLSSEHQTAYIKSKLDRLFIFFPLQNFPLETRSNLSKVARICDKSNSGEVKQAGLSSRDLEINSC